MRSTEITPVTRALRVIFAVVSALVLIPRDALSLHFGDLDLKLLPSVSGKYDDNVTQVKSDRKSDFVTTLGLQVKALFERKTQRFDLTAGVTQQLYASHNRYNNTAEDLSLNYGLELGRFDRIGVRDIFRHGDETSSFEEEFGRSTGRYSYYRNGFNADLTHEVTKQFSLTGRYSNDVYFPSRADLSDSYSNTVGGEASYAVSSRTTVLGSYDFNIRSFDPGGDAYTHTLAGGVRQALTEQLSIDGRVGVDMIHSFDKTDYTQPLYRVTLTDEIDERTYGSISFAKEQYTNSYSSNIFDHWQVSANYVKQLTARLSGSASGFYGQGEYKVVAIKDDLLGASAALMYDLLENIRASLSYSLSKTVSNIDTREYTRNVVSVALRGEF